MVKSIGYFSTAGYTELNGLPAFLNKIDSSVQWVRCFPAVQKGLLKKGPKNVTPIKDAQNGKTGQSLVSAMYKQLKAHGFDCDCILMVDDADCRFDGQPEQYQDWAADIQREIDLILGRHVPFFALLASPEMEAWFLVDWRNSFAQLYPPKVLHDFLHAVKADLGLDDFEGIETFGAPLLNGSCAIKISHKIEDIMVRCGVYYNKTDHGSAMLREIDPDAVARVCRTFFAPAYHELLQCIR